MPDAAKPQPTSDTPQPARKPRSTTSRSRPALSGVMESIVAQGQENVARLEETFGGPVTELATDYLRPNAANPRRRISEASVAEMVNGIEQVGGEILQPLLVRPVSPDSEGHRYEVVCGNRRLMAARRLAMPKVPVRLRELSDDQATRFALWENLAREDLDAMDVAESINGLRRIERLTWDDIGSRFGFSRQWVWKQQKMVELPESVKDMVREEQLSPSKAMLLAQISTGEEDILKMARRAVLRRLSHRALADEVSRLRKHVLTQPKAATQPGDAGEHEDQYEDEREDKRKHVLTWSPPRELSRRGFSSLVKATKSVVEAINEESLNVEYARSLADVARRILELADRPDPDSRKAEIPSEMQPESQPDTTGLVDKTPTAP